MTTCVTVRLPAALRGLAGSQAAIEMDLVASEAEVVTVGDVLAALRSAYTGVHDAVLDECGAVRRHVNVFVGAENIRFAAGLATPVAAGADVWILPAVSGG
jgi:molybdopterin converting factor small subunit